jgi:hypothetical protein
LAQRQADAQLRRLVELEATPEIESSTFRRLMVAERHPLWRVRTDAEDTATVQVRMIVWFAAETAHLLLGGNKAPLQGLWYDAAAVQGEMEVDAIRRRDE